MPVELVAEAAASLEECLNEIAHFKRELQLVSNGTNRGSEQYGGRKNAVRGTTWQLLDEVPDMSDRVTL